MLDAKFVVENPEPVRQAPEAKNAISHRARAFAALLPDLGPFLRSGG